MLFDCHVHSRWSVLDSRSEIGDILAQAKRMGLGAIAISDHDAIEGSLRAAKLSSKELIVIPSMEVSSADGHIIGLGVRERIGPGMSAAETVDRIHGLGGIAIAAHPYDGLRSGVGDLCWKLGFDAVEINSHCVYGNGRARREAEGHKKPLVGGSDAHSVDEIANICTEVGGRSADEILDNIKKGLCRPVYRKNIIALKTSVLAGKISRRVRKRL